MTMKKVIPIKYAKIREMDVANGDGIRVSLFVQGCEFKCKGCFNPETWDFNGGKEWTKEVEKNFISLIQKPHIKGVTILGGEPMHPKNIDTVSELIHNIKSACEDKTVWVYTGFSYEYLLDNFYYSLVNIDVLVDGRFIEEQKDLSLKFKGSTNQRIIDVKKSLKKDMVVLYK